MAKKPKPPTHWEIAKPLLLKDYLAGDITDAMEPSYVWKLRSAFWNTEYNSFRDNFAAMERSIKKHKERAIFRC